MLPLFLLLAVGTSCEDGLKPAISALQRNDAAGAVSLLDAVQSQCADSTSFYDLFGIANELSGNTVAAENALRQAVLLDPKSSRLFADLGATYLRNNKPKDAADALSQALTLDPHNAAACYLSDWRIRCACRMEESSRLI